jgi:hypothetical protein
MSSTYPAYGLRSFGKKTAAAGTAYTYFIEPQNNALACLRFLQFTVLGTAHTLTIMRPLSSQPLPSGSASNAYRCSCYLTAAAAASQSVININQNPGTYTAYFNSTPRTANNGIAANDYVAYQYPDGSWEVTTVSSVSTLAVTVAATLGTGGLASGAPVWFFGITTDTNPYDAQAHPAYNLFANSAPLNLGAEDAEIAATFRTGEPLLVYVNNATAASVLERGIAEYIAVSSPYANNGI